MLGNCGGAPSEVGGSPSDAPSEAEDEASWRSCRGLIHDRRVAMPKRARCKVRKYYGCQIQERYRGSL